MTAEQKAAHAKMLSLLPRKEHIAYDDPAQPAKPKGKHAKSPKAVIVNGKRHESLASAARATGMSRQLIHQRINLKKRGFSYAE